MREAGQRGRGVKWVGAGGGSEKILIKSTDLCQENAKREDRSCCSTMLKCKKTSKYGGNKGLK